ncbi:chemotaxis-specific protein-glutamate methyltransferase CheB [soil metagenome]
MSRGSAPLIDRRLTVLVVDDSAVARMHLVHLLEADPEIRVIGTVNDGEAAIAFLKEHQPNVVLMDVNMPGLDGFETTRRIMETHPVAVVICSGTENPQDLAATFRVLEAGAVACAEKPVGYERREFEQTASELRHVVKQMARIKMVTHWQRAAAARSLESSEPPVKRRCYPKGIAVVGIGASTGGPVALQKIFADLPKDFSPPILVVQHIGPGFIGGLTTWLGATTSLQIGLASHGAQPLPGHVYFAPDGHHMGLARDGSIDLSQAPPENEMRPAISYLFRSLARECGPAAVGVMLTGMGEDGAIELKQMRDEGAMTIAQDSATSVVHGMPGVAIALGGATHVSALGDIATKLVGIVRHAKANGSARS